jgi:hypothetical protein
MQPKLTALSLAGARPAKRRPAPLIPLPPPPDVTVVIPIAAALHFEIDLPYDGGERSLWALLLIIADDALRTHWQNRRGPNSYDATDFYTSDDATNDLTDFLIAFTANHGKPRKRHFIDDGALLHIEDE